ncbi:uncharacterized protein PV07_04222 [Cladophialophora immunda]|uniref:Uncharacterized protein n=1 Tax=Cladophialophora immunda TaxID=569365 RepID=A0A0D2CN72_9EURO|nr:uncharacterized protein PV07_04222 [Cladophialophora immunda]KIW32693.1 hypothetical protein PV07_04222 [Cladophialophora immunda]
MSAILCVAARHLNTLCPQSTKYSHESMQLMAKTVRPFRRNLSRPLTKDNCEALMGTALLVNYISWLDLGFLDGVTSAPPDSAAGVGAAKFDLSQDPLCFLSPGILQVWFQAIPVFIDHGSVFGLVVHQNPRLAIEEALAKRGEDPARFVEPLMRIWDDPRYHQTWACTAPYTGSADRGPTSYAWRLLRGLDTELRRRRRKAETGTVPGRSHKNHDRVLYSLGHAPGGHINDYLTTTIDTAGALIVREHRTPHLASPVLRISRRVSVVEQQHRTGSSSSSGRSRPRPPQ